MSYDLALFNAINGLAGHFFVLDSIGIFLANWLAYVLVLTLLCFLFFYPKRRVLLPLGSAITAAYVVKPALLILYYRARPFEVLPYAHKLIDMPVLENYQSFPSGHALFFFALATAVYLYHKKWGIFFFTGAAI